MNMGNKISGGVGMRKGFLVVLMLAIILSLYGCGANVASDHFLRQDVQLGFIKKVAVLPFTNHTKEQFIAERAREITITQVLSMGLFDVVDKGIVDSVLREEAIDPGAPLDKLTLRRLGQRLGVQAFILGSVDNMEESRRGSFSYPEFTLSLRLVEAKTSMVIWQSTGHGSGYSVLGRLFGLSAKDSFQVMVRVVRKMLSTIPAGAQS